MIITEITKCRDYNRQEDTYYNQVMPTYPQEVQKETTTLKGLNYGLFIKTGTPFIYS